MVTQVPVVPTYLGVLTVHKGLNSMGPANIPVAGRCGRFLPVNPAHHSVPSVGEQHLGVYTKKKLTLLLLPPDGQLHRPSGTRSGRIVTVRPCEWPFPYCNSCPVDGTEDPIPSTGPVLSPPRPPLTRRRCHRRTSQTTTKWGSGTTWRRSKLWTCRRTSCW